MFFLQWLYTAAKRSIKHEIETSGSLSRSAQGCIATVKVTLVEFSWHREEVAQREFHLDYETLRQDVWLPSLSHRKVLGLDDASPAGAWKPFFIPIVGLGIFYVTPLLILRKVKGEDYWATMPLSTLGPIAHAFSPSSADHCALLDRIFFVPLDVIIFLTWVGAHSVSWPLSDFAS